MRLSHVAVALAACGGSSPARVDGGRDAGAIDARARDAAGSDAPLDAVRADDCGDDATIPIPPGPMGGLAVDATHVYVISDDFFGNATGTLTQVACGPLTRVKLAGTTQFPATTPTGLALAGAELYYAQDTTDGSAGIYAGAAGTQSEFAQLVVAPFANAVAVDAAHVYFATDAGSAGPPGPSDDDLFSAPLAGGSALAIGSGDNAASVASDGSDLYVVSCAGGVDPAVGGCDDGKGSIVRMHVDGTQPTTLVDAVTASAAGGIAVDASHVYWARTTDATTATIMRADLDGDNAIAIGSGAFRPAPIALDATHVYWVDDGAVEVVAK